MGKQRTSFTAKEKLDAIDYAERLGFRAAGRHFDIPESNIRAWKKKEDHLKSLPITRRADRGATSKYPEMERELFNFVCDRRDSGIAVSTTELRLRAMQIKRGYGVTDMEDECDIFYHDDEKTTEADFDPTTFFDSDEEEEFAGF
ncbi:uncharacterized protein LOC132563270 [Ylistrum balloti]|uniref:uncharacterized protein LOC132563270 n=1 Tax=Ylistrum balloti TaxID=509963 RepID=UPI0029058254|nr:uncharacterized protein LOC132563270 [Ylistrum balloti]